MSDAEYEVDAVKYGWSVHNEPDFERVYDDDTIIEVRRGDIQALLDLATGSMDFGSGFWDQEQVEIARKIAGVLNVDLMLVTPSNFVCQYKGEHEWVPWGNLKPLNGTVNRFCRLCHHSDFKPYE